MNLKKINRYLNIVLIIFFIYVLITMINQQKKITSYEKDISYYTSQIDQLKEEKKELEETQSNVNSEEYIEEVAREQLEMYLPNETVFVDSSK